MATVQENSTRIDDIVNNSIKIDSPNFSDQDKRALIDVLFPNGVKFHYLDPKVQPGDNVYGKPTDPLIPDYSWDAEVVNVPITGEGDLKNINKY